VSAKKTTRDLPFITAMMVKLCEKIGAEALIEPEFGYVGQIRFKSGKRTFFRNRNSSINSHGAVEIARDKNYTSFFLKHMGYNVAEERTFFSDAWCKNLRSRRNTDAACAYAGRLGYPVIVKPNHFSQGVLVVKAWNATEVRKAAKKIFARTNVLLVQRFIPWRDYRVVVLDGDVISAYERIPLSVTGDGKRTIGALLKETQRKFDTLDRDTRLDLKDFRFQWKLRRAGLTLRSVPKRDEKVMLLDNANLCTGGVSDDVTPNVHADYRALVRSVARDMELRLCGIDILTSDLSKELDPKHVVLEINAAPGLDHYASSGRKQQKIVEGLYLKVLKALEKGQG
jgi:D-alanine-D-alanine ligase-like ATP-grasp enzyme